MRHRLSCLSWLGIVLVIGACELKPAPRKQPEPAAAPGAAAAPTRAPAGAPTPAPTGAAAAPAAAPAPAGAADDLGVVCMEIGVRAANILVASAADGRLKAEYEQARADTVRATAEACVRGKWDASLRQCFLSATTQPAFDACRARAPGPATSRPTRGS